MITYDLMKILLRERPNGVSFDPMAVRLLRRLGPFKEEQIEELKDKMFQLRTGLWFFPDMIADNDTLTSLKEQAAKWETEYFCFSIDRLLENYSSVLHHISTQEDFVIFLRHLGFSVDKYGGDFYCFISTSILKESLKLISKKIIKRIDDEGGELPLSEIEEMLPCLTSEALKNICTKFLPEIHIEEVGGIPCWRNSKAIHLPEDFSEKVTEAINALVVLGKTVNTGNLEFTLDILYLTPFRETYNLMNRSIFIRTCAEHYNGVIINKENFSREFIRKWEDCTPKKKYSKASSMTVSSIFADDKAKTSVVKKSAEMLGEECVINSWDSIDSEYFFSPENKIQSQKSDSHKERLGCEIVGLEGQRLKPDTWKAFRAAGTDPRIAEWVKRIKNGECIEDIADEQGYAVSTMKNMISNFKLYFKVCTLNNLISEGSINV